MIVTLFILSHEFAHFYDIWINKDKTSYYPEDTNISEVSEMYGQMNPIFLMVNLEKIYNNSKKAEEVRIQMLYDYIQMIVNNAMLEKFYIHLYQSEKY